MNHVNRAPSDTDGPDGPDLDEARLAELQTLVSESSLRPTPFAGDTCMACEYYLDESQGLSYCWHPKLRILVDRDWWCQWFEERE